jgi:hypothetical protein
MTSDVKALPKTSNARRARTCTRPRFRAGLAGLKAKLRNLAVVMGVRGWSVQMTWVDSRPRPEHTRLSIIPTLARVMPQNLA